MSSRYGVKDIFVTLQGEGARAGTKAVFIRFSGCNLWDGRPLHRDRGLGACSLWCDTDFFKGGVMSDEDIVKAATAAWGEGGGEKWCVLTGGEPCLQIDQALISALVSDGWRIAVETNGSEENDVVRYVDWICIAPKLAKDGEPLELALSSAHEIKVVLPGGALGQPAWTKAKLAAFEQLVLARYPGVRLFVQPQDPLVDPTLVSATSLVRPDDVDADVCEELDKQFQRNLKLCIDHVLANPRWSLSMQVHKFAGLQ